MHGIMQAAFSEYDGLLNPPPVCLTETVDDVAAAIRKGGALLAWIDGKAVGSARYDIHGGAFHVGRVSVLPTHRGYGIASIMMDYLEQLARTEGYAAMELETRLSLPRNVALYERLGFQIVDTWQSEAGADVQVAMMKPLVDVLEFA